MRWEAKLDDARALIGQGEQVRAADALANLLDLRLELRLECADLLAALEETHCDRHPLLWRAIGLNELESGRYYEAEIAICRAQALAAETQATDCLLDRALIARDRTDWATCEALVDEAGTRPLTPEQQLRVLNFRAVAELAYRFDLNRARKYFRQIESCARQSGNRTAYLTAVINRGLGVERVQGDYDAMLKCAHEISRHYGGDVPTEDRIYQLRLIAEARAALGEPESLAACQELVRIGTENQNANALGYGYGIAAYVHAERGEWEASRYCAERCEDQALPYNVVTAFAAIAESKRMAAHGQADEAQAKLRATLARIEAADRRLLVLLELAHLGETNVLEEAETLACRLGSPIDQVRVQLHRLALGLGGGDAAHTIVARVRADGLSDLLLRRHPRLMVALARRCLTTGSELQFAMEVLRRTGERFLAIRVFGDFQVTSQDGPVQRDSWTRPKARQLLAYLVSHLPHPVEIAQATDDLWPDLGPDEARNALRVAASYVRKALGLDCIQIHDGMIRLTLPEGAWVDHLQLRWASRSQDPEAWARALEEVGDERPLADISELWALDLRLTLEQRKQTLADRLLDHCRKGGNA